MSGFRPQVKVSRLWKVTDHMRHSEQVKVNRLWNTFPLSSWQIGEGQVSGLTTGGTGRSRTRFLDHSAALRTGEGE